MSGQCRESDTSVDADVALRSEERQICRGRGQAKGPWITSEENSERTEATACRRQLSESTVSPTRSHRPRHFWLSRSDSRPRRSLLVCAQDRIHPSLPPGTLRPEPFEDLRIHAQGNRFLGRRRLQPPSYDAPHDMRRVSFGVTPSCFDVPVTLPGDPCPVSSRCSRSRFPAHASSPFALK